MSSTDEKSRKNEVKNVNPELWIYDEKLRNEWLQNMRKESLKKQRDKKKDYLYQVYDDLCNKYKLFFPSENNPESKFDLIFNAKYIKYYFYYYKDRLFFTGNYLHLLLEIKDISTFFEMYSIPHTTDLLLENNIINNIKKILKISSLTLSPYQRLIKEFRILNKFENGHILDIPNRVFKIIDANLYIFIDNQLYCATYDKIKDWSKKVLGKKYDEQFWTRLIKSLPKELEYWDNYTNHGQPKATSSVDDENNFITNANYIYFNNNRDLSKIFYNYHEKKFVEEKADSNQKLSKLKIGELPTFSQKLFDFLELTFGDNENGFNEYARFITACVCPSKLIEPKLYVIQGDELSCNMIKNFTDDILSSDGNQKGERIGKWSYFNTPYNIPSWIDQDMREFVYYAEVDSMGTPEMKNIKLLKKLIMGKKVTKEDTLVKKIVYRNTLPLIYFSTRQENFNWIHHNLPYKIIDMNHFNKNINEIEKKIHELSKMDLYSLKIFFIFYGLKLLSIQDQNNKQTADSKVSTTQTGSDDAIDIFLSDFCTIDKSDKTLFTYFSDLYNAYHTFYEKKYFSKSISERKFIKELKGKEIFEYKKPRTSRTDSKWAFIGIKVNAPKLNEEYYEIKTENNELKIDIFEEKFNCIDFIEIFRLLKEDKIPNPFGVQIIRQDT
ncbi:hypothetical protein EDD66_104101 [Mobilisporobacter senegalensis]|uniref:Uncharacterized protein n=1 Tax=Mobilisporobacter senegalensis TaxID=1329262 RepID=A0A3N1XPB0_9FIRM|nr:hypothetical protein [Mobilisporobacter senegalensis]ROR28519.1 hypothetical protein EDD66_104101 [Mobilisporobacter senegalensis]